MEGGAVVSPRNIWPLINTLHEKKNYLKYEEFLLKYHIHGQLDNHQTTAQIKP